MRNLISENPEYVRIYNAIIAIIKDSNIPYKAAEAILFDARSGLKEVKINSESLPSDDS